MDIKIENKVIYSRDPNNVLEKFLDEKTHDIEDYLRSKCFKNQKITELEIILISRILYGRIINSKNSNYGKLDARHAKAQIITVICLVFYLCRHYNKLKDSDKNDIVHIIYHHLRKIDDIINDNNVLRFDKIKNQNYYEYCKNWKNLCLYFIENIENLKNIEDIKDKESNFKIEILNKTVSKITLKICPIKHRNLIHFLSKYKVSNFLF